MTTSPIDVEATQVRDDWQLAIDEDMVLRGQGADASKIRARSPGLVALAKKAIEEGKLFMRPRVAYRWVEIASVRSGHVVFQNGVELQGLGISSRLKESKKVVVAVATLGEELEERIQKASGTDLPLQLALDGVGTAAIGALTTAARNFFLAETQAQGSHATPPLYPGMRGWDLAAGQRQIFSLVDARFIGVTLTPSFLMTPRKSISIVIGFGQRVRPTGEPCEDCSAVARCQHKPVSA